MSSRERLKKTLSHETPDRLCVDFGATVVTGIHVSCVAALRDYYHLEKRPVKVHDPYQMLGWIEEDLMKELGVDVIGVLPRNTIFGFPNENWKEFRMPWGQEVLVSEHFKTTTDANGDLLVYPEGDTSAPPSGRMPKSGFFVDTIIRQESIDENKLDPRDNLEEFTPISRQDLDHFKTQVDQVAGKDYGVVASFGGTAFGDIALVPAPFLKHPRGIRDIAEWYMSTASRQDYIHAIFARQCEIAVENLKKIWDVLGNRIHVVFICGADFGTQTSQFCSTGTFTSLYAPYYRKINDWIHAHTAWKTFKHSCGAVEPFMRPFIDAGFDIINPVQCSAAGMDPEDLKTAYGDELVFWGGGVDTQKTMPFGTVEEVYDQVRQRIDIFGEKGGFVFNAVHNLQAKTPVENIAAMVRAIQASYS